MGRIAIPDDKKRVMVSTTVAPATAEKLAEMAIAEGISLGRLLDKLVEEAKT